MKLRSLPLLVAGVLCIGNACHADTQSQMVRALAAKYQSSLVTLSLVVKIGAGGSETQTEMEAGGVLLDSSGLVATTNTGIDPMAAYSEEVEQYGAAMTTRVVGVKILTTSGQEIPAKVVLRDKDKNLAFVRPLKKPDIKLTGIKLTGINFNTTSAAQLGDPIYLLGRQGRTGSRSIEAGVERVVSVMNKPRRFYVLDAPNATSVGSVAFNEQGAPLGLLTLRFPLGKARFSESNLPVIIPARDVWEVARQAPQAKDVRNGSTTPRPAPAKPNSKPAPAKSP